MEHFKIITSSSLHLAHTNLALATIHAEGLPIFDLNFCTSNELPKAIANLKKFNSEISENTEFGFKISINDIKLFKPLLTQELANKPKIILTQVVTKTAVSKLPKWVFSISSEIWLEVHTTSQVSLISNDQFSGVVVKGSEAGGVIGEETTFVLAQTVAKHCKKPFYIQGGIGLHTAVACKVVGASGIVLDDQLLAFKEAPIPKNWHKTILQLASENTQVLSINNTKVRALKHPLFSSKHIGWQNPETNLWPIGQSIGFTKTYVDKYKTVGRFIQALRNSINISLNAIKEHIPLSKESALATSHGTTYPIVQGPMTRVSDQPEFLKAVADSGALPFLALSMLKGDKAINLLNDTKKLLGEKPWGVGILGFVPEELRVFQLKELCKVKPNFAIIAGGTTNQVNELEEAGIPTYTHAPNANLLHIFLERGLKRFVLEGRECGGHVGPLGSFVLWESAIAKIAALPKEKASEIHILFAGGIHDSQSAAMVNAMSATLAAKGVKIGVVMGTAYLFTKEACESGAILPQFQKAALECKDTAVIETGPGHAIRCIPTPFVDEFNAEKSYTNTLGLSAQEASEHLEKLTLGRLRLASKGLIRDKNGALKMKSQKEQYEQGMFMIGQIANSHSTTFSMADLHKEVSVNSTNLLKNIAPIYNFKNDKNKVKPSEIAVVGMSTILPGAANIEEFWELILESKKAIQTVPKDYWDSELYYDKDLKTRDKVVSKWGGFIKDILFNPLKYGIPPQSLKSISPAQLIMLEAVYDALKDADYEDGGYDKENTSVIVGSDGGSLLRFQYATRTMMPQSVGQLSDSDYDRLPEWTEESFSGILTSVLAGRIANRFDLGGANFSVDAACASSLTAIDLAIKELEHGHSNVCIAGGMDIAQSPFSYTAFSKTQALSPTGESNPFDANANGIVISEGAAVVILKRLEDAKRDGDKIYCVLKGSAGSSDGKGLSLTAPSTSGQVRAFNRAYKKAGFTPDKLGYYEAHGTGTPLGDKVELETINTVLNHANATIKKCAIGSVKSLIGHTKTTAGIVGLIKSALAIYYKTIPPHKVKNQPLQTLLESDSHVFITDQPKAWITNNQQPRRAGVSAFGFGGTNSHLVVEEYLPNTNNDVLGNSCWPASLFLFTAKDNTDLLQQLNNWNTTLKELDTVSLNNLGYASAIKATEQPNAKIRLAFSCKDKLELTQNIAQVIQHLETDSTLPPNISLNTTTSTPKGKLAFLFPGQGSQVVNMGKEASLYLESLRNALTQVDALDRLKPLSKIIYPPTAFNTELKAQQASELKATQNAQPAIGAISAGYLGMLNRLDIKPDAYAGHSYGEFTALYAAGIIDLKAFLTISQTRGNLMGEHQEKEGTMAVVYASEEETQRITKDQGIYIANVNAPKQTIISGLKSNINAAIALLNAKEIKARELPVSGAFHTPYFEKVQAPLSKVIDATVFNKSEHSVYSNVTALPYSDNEKDIKTQLKSHLLSPVLFKNQILNMYNDGVRYFLEVGPKQVLSGLVKQTLENKTYKTYAIEGVGGGLKGILNTLGQLFTSGFNFDIDALFTAMHAQPETPKQALANQKNIPPQPVSVWVNGAGVRPINKEKLTNTKLPPLQKATRNTTPTITNTTQTPQVRNNTNIPMEEQTLLEGFKAYQKTMQEFLRNQEATLQLFLNNQQQPNHSIQPQSQISQFETSKIEAVQPNPISELEGKQEVVPVTHTEPQIEKKTESNIIDKESIKTEMVAIISERTGYPKEMITSTIDLEAELSIDSIKRIEIMDKTLRLLPKKHEALLKDVTQQIMRTKSIDEFLSIAFSPEITNQLTDETKPLVVENINTEQSTTEVVNFEQVPRFIMKPVYQELNTKEEHPITGVYLITEDQGKVAKLVANKIQTFGGTAILLQQDTLDNPELLESTLQDVLKEHNSVQGVIHCTPLSINIMPNELSDWKAITQLESKSLFQIVKWLHHHKTEGESAPVHQIIATSLFGGYFGRRYKSGPSLPSAGANCGLLKSIQKEWNTVQAWALDFDDSLLDAEIANRIIKELKSGTTAIEIGYPEGERVLFVPEQANIDPEVNNTPFQLDAEAVILATGGAKGITAEICKAISAKDMTLVLVGRSKTVDLHMKNDALNSGSFKDLEALGIKIDYQSVDLLNENEVAQLFENIYSKYGRLDAIIHGAGVIEDNHIDQKQLSSFNRVFDTKVDTTFLISKYAKPESLKLMVLFGSVSGRFGNQGQTDYAAANEVLNRFAWRLRNQWKQTKILTINWGPWSILGMASPMVLRLLESQGMKPIHPEAGCEFFIQELTQDAKSTSEVIAGGGPWANHKIQNENQFDFSEIFNHFMNPENQSILKN